MVNVYQYNSQAILPLSHFILSGLQTTQDKLATPAFPLLLFGFHLQSCLGKTNITESFAPPFYVQVTLPP